MSYRIDVKEIKGRTRRKTRELKKRYNYNEQHMYVKN
jgi:hypothetical protein